MKLAEMRVSDLLGLAPFVIAALSAIAGIWFANTFATWVLVVFSVVAAITAIVWAYRTRYDGLGQIPAILFAIIVVFSVGGIWVTMIVSDGGIDVSSWIDPILRK